MKPGIHAEFADHSVVEGPSDRKFGLTVGGILAAIGLIRWVHAGSISTVTTLFLAVGFGLIVFAIAAPRLLSPLNNAWMKLGLLLSRIVNPIIMLLIFSVIFVPVALIMKAIGRDALGVKAHPGAHSYWIVREPPGPAPETIIHQF